MDVDMKDASGPLQFTKGERYSLVVSDAKEGVSNKNRTPYLKISLATDPDGEDAGAHTLWMTPKALYRWPEWMDALQISNTAPANAPAHYTIAPDRLAGIRLTAIATHEKHSDDNGKEYTDLVWTKPEAVRFGDGAAFGEQSSAASAAPAPSTAPAQASAAAPAQSIFEPDNGDVPF